MEDMAETSAGMTRRTLIKRGAVVGGTLIWAAPVIDSFTSPAFGAVDGTPLDVCCRFTGGGFIDLTAAEPTLWPLEPSSPTVSAGNQKPSYGFELHCGNPAAVPNRLTIKFFDAEGEVVVFHLHGDNEGDHTYTAACFPPPTGTPDAPCSIIEGSGTGRVTGGGSNEGEATITFTFRDVSEPGWEADQVTFTINYTDDEGNAATYSASGNPVSGGNEQAHRTTGSKADC